MKCDRGLLSVAALAMAVAAALAQTPATNKTAAPGGIVYPQ
jgi:hypothetical protein